MGLPIVTVTVHIREPPALLVFVRELDGACLGDFGGDVCDVRFYEGAEGGEVGVVGLEVGGRP